MEFVVSGVSDTPSLKKLMDFVHALGGTLEVRPPGAKPKKEKAEKPAEARPTTTRPVVKTAKMLDSFAEVPMGGKAAAPAAGKASVNAAVGTHLVEILTQDGTSKTVWHTVKPKAPKVPKAASAPASD